MGGKLAKSKIIEIALLSDFTVPLARVTYLRRRR